MSASMKNRKRKPPRSATRNTYFGPVGKTYTTPTANVPKPSCCNSEEYQCDRCRTTRRIPEISRNAALATRRACDPRLTSNRSGNEQRAAERASQATLASIAAFTGSRDADWDAAAKAHVSAAIAHEGLATEARVDGDNRGAEKHDEAAALHRKAASAHASRAAFGGAESGEVDNEDDDDSNNEDDMSTNQCQVFNNRYEFAGPLDRINTCDEVLDLPVKNFAPAGQDQQGPTTSSLDDLMEAPVLNWSEVVAGQSTLTRGRRRSAEEPVANARPRGDEGLPLPTIDYAELSRSRRS